MSAKEKLMELIINADEEELMRIISAIVQISSEEGQEQQQLSLPA